MQPLILAEQTRQGIADFLASTFPATTSGFTDLLPRFLADPQNLAKGPYVTVGLPFRQSREGTTPFEWLTEFKPHAHQARSFERLATETPRSTIVATGTGSGKTECFLYPVLEHCRRERQAGRPGIKAVLIYPMNALATDQANRLAKEILTRPGLEGITAGLYVGDEPGEVSTTVRVLDDGRFTVITDRDRMRDEPPDILLTNYKMLDFLLIRARDSELWRHNAPDTLKFLVVDELHTFDGAQGTDLACLIRRLKARLGTPPGALACVGTSATLGSEGHAKLIEFAQDVFGEVFEPDAIIGEDRQSVAEYLEKSTIEYMRRPRAADYARLSSVTHDTLEAYIAAQYALWFGKTVEAGDVGGVPFRVQLGQQLHQHVAFHNLLRDLQRLGGRSVAVADLVDAVTRRLEDAAEAPADYPVLWLTSLLALVAHASKEVKPGKDRDPLLTVRVELWLRELRRMVASLGAQPRLVHSDDLAVETEGFHLPLVHCRDCHAMGWGATVTKTAPGKLKNDLKTFYAAFFSFDVNTRFVFPADPATIPNPKKFERRAACPGCGSLGGVEETSCNYCGREDLLPVDIASNLRRATRDGATYYKSHHDCPYCEGERSLTIVGAQAASLASVGVHQFFGSRYNADKKLITFSDSVQDAAHRAGFFGSRTWLLNLRPALAQVIHAAIEQGTPLTLKELPAAFESRWKSALGEVTYLKTFLPPAIAWLRDYDRLLHEDKLPEDDYLRMLVRRGLTWTMLAEFGQSAHVGRTLPRTRTASLGLSDGVIEAATQQAMLRLRERVDALKDVSEAEVRVFLYGLLGRLLRLGAVWDEFLVNYAKRGSNVYVVRNNPAEFAMLATPRRPRYLTLVPFKQSDSVTGEDSVFYRDWALKALDGLNREVVVDETLMVEIYSTALKALEGQGVVKAIDAEREGTTVWGVEPGAFTVLGAAQEWRCERCRHAVIGPPLAVIEGTLCRQVGCRGRYAAHAVGNGEYYRQLYLSADVQRIFAKEHTGLLSRSTREQVEKDFKQGRVNLLSATPTLEMGIDIGDLSSVLLCSVPPAQANYVQRIGRAGRRTGNAFNATVAAGRPHDLYFWANPLEMLAGSVDTPGVFLNASAVLERQLTAYTLDCWVHEFGAKAKIPGQLSEALSAVRNKTQGKFPYPWLANVDQHRATLLASFMELFKQGQGDLSEDSKKYLENFIDGGGGEGTLAWKIVNRLHGVLKDIDDLRGRRTRVEKEIERIDALPVKGDGDLEDLRDLKQEKAALTRLIASLNSRDTLQFLTDEGLLPNYAFPEQGVLLHSVIIRDDKKVGQDPEDRILTFEYERPGASAITEFAPNNAFYAEDRKVTIEQVDISRDQPAKWRFCRNCSYAELDPTEPVTGNCPRCDDSMWSDAGRVQTMVRLSKVYARTLDSHSRIGDDADDRDRHYYVSQALVDVAPNAVLQAWKIDQEEYPFAFEFLDRIRFREVNFGEQTGDGQPIQIAGNEEPKPGFVLCAECGTLQKNRSDDNEWRNHALYCSSRRDNAAAERQCVFLYREFASEGMRLYLPESSAAEAEAGVHSFIAALRMGLEAKFRGSVDHLKVERDVRIAQGQETPRQYIVLYDSVPGGTGYLKQVMRDTAPLFEVFTLALEKLNTCRCVSDETKDGCYSCLYGYHNSHDRKHVSRRVAVRLLSQIVGHKDKLTPVSTIGEVIHNSLFDSELERLFIEALRRKAADGSPRIEVKEELVRGKPGYVVRAGEQHWRMEPQVNLGAEQGVVIPSKPDYVLWPETEAGALPIAVFLDGWKFHKDSIGTDIAKRMAIARSGRYSVWSLTYDDIAAFLDAGKSKPESPWAAAFAVGADAAEPMYAQFGIKEQSSLHMLTAFEQLRARLVGLDDSTMLRLGLALALRIGAGEAPEDEFKALKTSAAGQALEALAVFEWPSAPDFGRCWSAPNGRMQIGVQAKRAGFRALPASPGQRELQPCIVLRWAGDEAGFADDDRRRLWQQWWQAANLLMPVGNAWAVADVGSELAALAQAPAYQAASGMSGDWEAAAACAAPAVQGLLAALFAAGVKAPEVGYELMGADGCVAADSELAWPARKVAVLTGDDAKPVFVAAGWNVFVVGDAGLVERLVGLLK